MVVPIVFRRGGEGAVASYDFYDVASGSGYIEFYAGRGMSVNLLSTFKFYSNCPDATAYVYTSGSTNSGTFTKKVDLDFDVVLNKPLVIYGRALVNAPYSIKGDTSTVQGYTWAHIKKVSGGTETEIISCSGAALSANTTETFFMPGLEMDVPLTVFKKGDTLRLTVEGWVRVAASTNATIHVAHDPMARTINWDAATDVSSALKFICPVRIDI